MADAKLICEMVNGYGLFVKDNEVGGRTYYSDEIGGGVVVWDTALVGEETLLTAMLEERRIQNKERVEKLKQKKKIPDLENNRCIHPKCECLDFCEAQDPYSETPK